MGSHNWAIRFAYAGWLCLYPALGAQYQANWESLDKRPTPAWFSEAKFGIFIHWGVYSVPAYAAFWIQGENPYAEWYWNSLTLGRNAKTEDGRGTPTWRFHQRVYGKDFEYFDFAPLFRAELFDPEQWAEIFERSGARYVVLTSKHHDGYALWPSAEATRSWKRPWNAMEIGPRRDLLGELTAAVRARGLRMGFYYSLYEWYNPLWLADRKRYVEEHMFPQFKDAVTRYRPAIIFSDGEWDMDSAAWRTPELLAWLFNDSPVAADVVVNDRWGKDTRHRHGGYYTTEYTAGLQAGTHPWEENRGMGHSYGWNRMERAADYQSARALILMLVDLVSRGGNLLLNVGPTGDGRIPVIMEERLRQMGEWLKINGEAIYGTAPWRISRLWGPGNVPKFEEKTYRADYDLRKLVDEPAPGNARVEAFFTSKGDAVYVILPRWPAQILIPGAASASARARLLENGRELKTRIQGNDLVVQLPPFVPGELASREAWVVKLTGMR
jgi:alpha-L-fucosidase